MSQDTHFSKIIEFLYRTDFINQYKETELSYELIVALTSLAWECKWDVDVAVNNYMHIYESAGIEFTEKAFDKADYLDNMRGEMCLKERDIPQFMKLLQKDNEHAEQVINFNDLTP